MSLELKDFVNNRQAQRGGKGILGRRKSICVGFREGGSMVERKLKEIETLATMWPELMKQADMVGNARGHTRLVPRSGSLSLSPKQQEGTEVGV